MRRSVAVTVLLLLLCAGCSESSASSAVIRVDSLPGGIPRTLSSAPVDREGWHLVPVRDIQPPELADGELIQPNDLAIADDGSVLVAEARPAHVKVYGPDGAYLRSIGREGSGPGEFRSAYIAIRGDTLVVQDAQNARATSFNWRTGAMLSERRTSCCYYFPIGIDSRGRAASRALTVPRDSSLGNPQAFVRFPINGGTADSIEVPAGHVGEEPKNWLVREGDRIRLGVVVPLQPRAIHVVDPTGGFVTGYTSEYVIRRSREGRDTTQLFGRDWSPALVTADEKSAIVERRIEELRRDAGADLAESTLRASLDPSFIPDTRPAFETLWIDPVGRAWVRLSSADSTTVQFDLFDREGRWLDVVDVPGAGWPRSPWASAAFGRTEAAVSIESEDGRPLIRVYRIERR